MRHDFRGNAGHSEILRRAASFLLVCLFFICVLLPEQRAEAADPITTANHYEWKQIKTQADIPAKGTYPMLLCYTDLNGNDWFLTGNSLKDDRHLCRDGISDRQTDWPVTVKNRYRAWLEENGRTDSALNKSEYMKAFPSELMLLTQYQDEPMESDFDTNYMAATDASKYPEIALYSESFYTKAAPSDWKMIVTGETADGLKTIQIQSGNQYLYDGYSFAWGSFMAMIEWNSKKASSYSVYTTDVQSDRLGWTLDGYVQLFYYDGSLGFDTGLCWDYGNFGGIEENNDHFSNFKLYYGVNKEFSVIDQDYVVTAGSILYANDNLELMPDVNLIIEPGGILSVNGVFYQNGVIHNCGTMILNPGSVVTTLEPELPNCGQINCYGSSMIRFAAKHAGAELPGQKEYYSMSLYDLEKEIRYLDENIEWAGRQSFDTQDMIDDWTAQKAEMEAVYQCRKYPNEAIQKLLKSMEGDEYAFSHCGGELIILEGAALLLGNQPESRLNLYEGSTCSNLGVIVAPYGIYASGGELKNQNAGHLFIGYYFVQDMGNDEKPTVIGAGTPNAAIMGLKAAPVSRALLDLSGKYHLQNDGTLLLNGALCRTAENLEPGSRFYDKNEKDNRKYYGW